MQIVYPAFCNEPEMSHLCFIGEKKGVTYNGNSRLSAYDGIQMKQEVKAMDKQMFLT